MVESGKSCRAETITSRFPLLRPATWRNAYLQGASELRHGSLPKFAMRGRQYAHAMTAEQIFDTIGIRFDPGRCALDEARLSWRFTDLEEEHVLGIARRTIHHVPDTFDATADVCVTTSRHTLVEVLADNLTLDAAIEAGDVEIVGDVAVLATLLSSLEVFMTQNIVEP